MLINSYIIIFFVILPTKVNKVSPKEKIMSKFIYAMFAMAFTIMPMDAYCQKAKKKTAVKSVVAKPKVDPAIAAMKEKMMEAVQKIVVFDSIVVDKANFLSAYNIDPDIATVTDYDSFFSTTGHPKSFVSANGMKTRSYFSMADSLGNTNFFRSDFIGGQWTTAMPIYGIDTNDTYPKANYPYMMTDGLTLYFAAKGSKSIGGYDIFVTRYDNDSKAFLQPENIGMPFNSTANDYMLVIDDINKIGWFASDRNQPEGMVCIYKFVPSSVRENYDSDEMEDDLLESLAQLKSISDTWAIDKQAQKDATKRYADMLSRIGQSRNSSSRDGEMYLVINDNHVYTNTRQFVVKANIERYYQLTAMKAELKNTNELLDGLRKQYGVRRRADVQSSIISCERESERLQQDITKLEKTIVNSENQAIDR